MFKFVNVKCCIEVISYFQCGRQLEKYLCNTKFSRFIRKATLFHFKIVVKVKIPYEPELLEKFILSFLSQHALVSEGESWDYSMLCATTLKHSAPVSTKHKSFTVRCLILLRRCCQCGYDGLLLLISFSSENRTYWFN